MVYITYPVTRDIRFRSVSLLSSCIMHRGDRLQLHGFNPQTYKGGGGGAHKVFLSFLLEDKKSTPDVFGSCSFIPRAHCWIKFSGGQFLWLRDMT